MPERGAAELSSLGSGFAFGLIARPSVAAQQGVDVVL